MKGKVQVFGHFPVELVAPHGQSGLKLSVIALESRMDDAAVGLGDPEGKLGLFFQEDQVKLVLSQGLGDGNSDDPAADDEKI